MNRTTFQIGTTKQHQTKFHDVVPRGEEWRDQNSIVWVIDWIKKSKGGFGYRSLKSLWLRFIFPRTAKMRQRSLCRFARDLSALGQMIPNWDNYHISSTQLQRAENAPFSAFLFAPFENRLSCSRRAWAFESKTRGITSQTRTSVSPREDKAHKSCGKTGKLLFWGLVWADI